MIGISLAYIFKKLLVLQVKIWDPSMRGSELRATLKGHTRLRLKFFLIFYLLLDPFVKIYAACT